MKAEQIPKFGDALRKLYKQFYHSFPWMYLVFLNKHNGKRYFSHYIASVPCIELGHEESSKNLFIRLQWQGTNSKEFMYQKKEESTASELDKVFGSKNTQKKDWTSVASYPKYNKYSNAMKYKKNTFREGEYAASSTIHLKSVKKIDIYDWGFEIETNGFFDIVALRSKAMKNGTASNNRRDVEYALAAMMGDEFVFPSSNIKSSLLYFWDCETEYGIQDTELDKLLAPPEKKEKVKERIMDVGQKSGHNILLE